jgi:hypothetical protein
MKPFAIVPRATAERELKYYGYDMSNVVLMYQANAFMTSSYSELWGRTIFFPIVEPHREDIAYNGKALLLLDGLGSNHIPKFRADCSTRNIEILARVPRASDQIQPLDLLIFGLLRQAFSASRFNCLTNPQSNKVARILDAWFAASGPYHNVGAFMSIGLILVGRDGWFILTAVPEKARRVRGSAEFEPTETSFHPMPMAGIDCTQGSEQIIRFLMSSPLSIGENSVGCSELSAILNDLMSTLRDEPLTGMKIESGSQSTGYRFNLLGFTDSPSLPPATRFPPHVFVISTFMTLFPIPARVIPPLLRRFSLFPVRFDLFLATFHVLGFGVPFPPDLFLAFCFVRFAV